MIVRSREERGVTILTAEGKLTFNAGDVVLRQAIQEEISAGATRILLDLGRVTTIDSSGLGELVAAATTIWNRGGTLKLLHLSQKVADVLQITQLVSVFEIFDDEYEALASFQDS